MDYGTMHLGKWTMPIMDDAASKQVRSNLQLQASNLCSLPISFSFTHFRKNASANPFVSHTFKTKDLKPFRFTHFQKRGRGEGVHLDSRCTQVLPPTVVMAFRPSTPCHGRAEAVLFCGHQALCFRPQLLSECVRIVR